MISFRFPILSFFCVFVLGLVPMLADAAKTVMIEIAEPDVGQPGEWPINPVITERYTESAFGLSDLPYKYVTSGVRADRAVSTYVRASAEIILPVGRHRVLLRARGESRLVINDHAVLQTASSPTNAYEGSSISELPFHLQDAYLDLGPDFRFAPPGVGESWGEFDFDGTPAKIVMETRIGGLPTKGARHPFRPEVGETVVAYSLAGSDQWWLLGEGDRPVPYTDAGWEDYAARQRRRLDIQNAEARAACRQQHSEYWSMRRQEAEKWLASTLEVPVPALPAGYPAFNAIDRFIADRLVRAKAELQSAAGGPDFFDSVRPILETHCYSCHQGSKVKGGLRLDNRADAFRGGKADGPSIVAGHPDDSPLLLRIVSDDPEEVMPAKGDRLSAAEVATLRQWIEQGAHWPDLQATRLEPTPLTDDLTFLRRLTLDTVGVVPSEAEIYAFLADAPAIRRTRAIDRLLPDPRWADRWMGYWQDVLAENPNLINPNLNNTGPFRWWIYESLLDNKPLDLFVTELLRLEGSEAGGGPAGFGVATENDVPMATKGMIVSSAFLGVEMKCARCHDAPTHVSKQAELMSLAAMLKTTPITLPATSSVAMDHLRKGGRKPLIEVTLAPGSEVRPAWPFAQFCDEDTARRIADDPTNTRDLLAALITAPKNERFAQVMANRVWQHFMGRGLVAELGDWEKALPSHPELLRWLGRELVRSGYDLKALARLIVTSHAYQRASDPAFSQPEPLFAAPAARRIGAEQLVDSLFAATGKPFHVERVCLDIDSSRPMDLAIDLGTARRAWMLGSISNERDRPSLSLPRIQAVADVLQVFGWRDARPEATNGLRDTSANLLQPALLSNGVMIAWLTRLSDDHGFTALALEGQSLDTLIERVFMRLFTRPPTQDELDNYRSYLGEGYEDRIARNSDATEAMPSKRVRPKYVSWSNHALSEANTLRMEEEVAARRGDPPTSRLHAPWRQRFEDVIWALVNSPELTRIM